MGGRCLVIDLALRCHLASPRLPGHREKVRVILEAAETRLIKRTLSLRNDQMAEDGLAKTKKPICPQHIRQHKRQSMRLANAWTLCPSIHAGRLG